MSTDRAVVQRGASRRRRLVFGSAALGDDVRASPLLDRFVSGGGQALDLANVYGDGACNRVVGRWLARSRAAPRLYVKGCHPPYCAPGLVGAEVDRARAALGVETLDVFILHRDDEAVAVGAFADTLRDEVARASIASFGVSNWAFGRFGALLDALGEDRDQLTVLSNQFSLAPMVTPVLPGCVGMGRREISALGASGQTALAWASTSSGYFARHASSHWSSPANERRRAEAERIGAAHGTSATAVALAYVLAQPDHVRPVVATTAPHHLEELLRAADLELARDELARLTDQGSPARAT